MKGDVERFASELAARGAPGVRDGLEITLPRPSGGERVIFEAAAASGAQLRYLGPSVRTMDELFRTLVRAKGEGRTT
ncbi:MAG TPA: hypothetical protein VGV64_06820 [Thermoplasmata archaeon]|nr:hypothetical protein [Thermoplasmata archaeon]HEV2429537.1 hypothetical protein [Thermoplasmata archaeon]